MELLLLKIGNWLDCIILFLVSAFLIGLLCNKIFFGISGLTFTSISNIVSYIFCEALYHMAVSTLAISLVFLIRNSSVSMAVNALLIFLVIWFFMDWKVFWA